MPDRKAIPIGPLELDLDHGMLRWGSDSQKLEKRHGLFLRCLASAKVRPGRPAISDVVSEQDLREALGRNPGGTDGASLSSIRTQINEAINALGCANIVKVKNERKRGYYLWIDYPVVIDQASSDSRPSVRPSRSHLAAPTREAREFASRFNAGAKRIVGDVIEVYPHPDLGSGRTLSDTGWSPNQINISLKPGRFDATEILNDIEIRAAFDASEAARESDGKESALSGDNNPKYGVVDVSSPFLDSSELSVMFQETDYFTVMRARPGVGMQNNRIRFGHIDPNKSRIPQAISVQFVAIFSDGNLLTIQRSKNTFPWAGTWSFSGEEQCAEIDFVGSQETRLERFLLRAVVEEVFPLGTSNRVRLDEAMHLVKKDLRSMRVWSIFLEELTGIFQLFAVFELRLSRSEYVDAVHELIQDGIGVMSQEGQYFTAAMGDVEDLLSGNPIPAKPLFGKIDEEISPSMLHPTSRYRLLRLLDYYR